MRLILCALALGAAVSVGSCAVGARARHDPPAPSTAAAGGEKPAHDDPKARALIAGMLSAYKSLASYSGTLEVQSGAGKERIRATLAFRRPGRAAIAAAGPGG